MSETLAQFTAQTATDIATLNLVGIDPQKTQGTRYRQISAAGMLSAAMAAYQAELAGNGGTFTASATGITVAVGGYTDKQLYTSLKTTNDVCMQSLTFGQATIVPQSFYFQIYAGPPSSGNPTLLYDSSVSTGTTIKTALASAGTTIYVAAAGGTNALWIRFYNMGAIPLILAFQGVFLDFPGNGIVLPTYVTPAPYLGPLLSTVHVGPNEQFIEPRYGLQALADGGTMFVDDGHYFLPIGFLSSASAASSRANYGGTSANVPNRFGAGATIVGNSTYGTVFDGLGGAGAGFPLTQGKGWFYTQAPLTLKTLSVINAGGADKVSDGEAAVYGELFASPGTITLQNVGIDNCENGVFIPDKDLLNSNGTVATANAGPGANVSLVVNACDFGFNASNGTPLDGYSHNMYIEGPSTTVTGSHFYGCTDGNTLKNRGPSLTVSGSYLESGGGRCIDMPEGGTMTVNNTTLTSNPTAGYAFLGYIDEQKGSRQGQYNPQFTGCTLLGTFGTGTSGASIWYGVSGGYYNFTNCTQQWYAFQGGPPSFNPQLNQSQLEVDTSCAQGLFLNPTQGGTTLSARPTRPASIASPGAVSTPITAWNGTMSNNWN